MAKPLKFHQTLNQAPRSAKHGQHRRASKTPHRNSFVGADYSAGGTDKSGAVWYSSGWTTSYSPIYFPEPEPSAPVPYAGVRTGELTAYRAWFVVNNYELRSLAHYFIWEPGATISGDVMKPVDDPFNLFRRDPIMGGVYTHFTADHTLADLQKEWLAQYPMQMVRERDPFASVFYSAVMGSSEIMHVDTFLGVAVGTVKLWGEVVEHERGYRAEHAKLVSIDQVCGVVDIARLRTKYFSP